MTVLRIILPDQLNRSCLEDWIEQEDAVLTAETGYLFGGSTRKWKLDDSRRIKFQLSNLQRKKK